MAILDWRELVAILGPRRPEGLSPIVDALLAEAKTTILDAVSSELNAGVTLTHDDVLDLVSRLSACQLRFHEQTGAVTFARPRQLKH